MDTRLLATVIAVSLTACGVKEKPAAQVPFEVQERVGWIHGACLAITNPNVAAGTPVALVIMNEPQVVRQAKVEQKVDSNSPNCPALAGERGKLNSRAKLSFYALNPTNATQADMGIGILSPAHSPEVDPSGRAVANLTGESGPKQVFSSCMTSEGVRFQVWNQKPYQGQPVWSGYYYVDYDTTPSCPQ